MHTPVLPRHMTIEICEIPRGEPRRMAVISSFRDSNYSMDQQRLSQNALAFAYQVSLSISILEDRVLTAQVWLPTPRVR